MNISALKVMASANHFTKIEKLTSRKNSGFLSLRLEGEETLKYGCVCRPTCGKFQYSKQVTTIDALKVRFFCFRLKLRFLGKFVPKNQTCQFKLKFGSQTYSNMQHSIVVFTFSFLNQKYPFCGNLVQNLKIVSLSLYFVLTLAQICKIQW